MIHREPNRPFGPRPAFWNVSGLLKSYLEMFAFQQGSVSVSSRPLRFPSATLNRAWEAAFDACTIEDALRAYQIILELLAAETERIIAGNWPSLEKRCALDCLHQQQTKCLADIDHLREVKKFPFKEFISRWLEQAAGSSS